MVFPPPVKMAVIGSQGVASPDYLLPSRIKK